MLKRCGLDDMMETSEGLYVTMQILRKFMGGFSLRSTKLEYPDVTIAMLNDMAKYSIQFDDHDNAWQLSVSAYKIGVAYKKEEGALGSFKMLYKISSSSHDRLKPAMEKIAEHALKVFVKKGWATSDVTPILNEVQGNIQPIKIKTEDRPVDLKKLPKELMGWMDVLSLEQINGASTLVVRNEQLHARVGIDVSQHPQLQQLKTGHKVALANGDFKLTITHKDIVDRYAVMLLIDPSPASEISYEGEAGFSYLKVAEPEET
jgi:hypothetical protein